MKQISNFIDIYNEVGEVIFDEYIVPLFKTNKDIVFEEFHLDKIDKYKMYKSEVNLKKFVTSFRKFSTDQINEKLNNLDDKDKEFLLDIISNLIELNDKYQIFILAYLTKEYLNDKRLIFWQKSLYYNIKTLSEDDFKIYVEIIETSERKENKGDEHYILTSLNKEQEIVKDKFITLGIFYPDANRAYGQNINFKVPEHAIDFYRVLKSLR